MLKKNLVSVVTPCFNSEEFINETIMSVVEQTYTEWEIIVVDDCSTDNTVNCVKKLQSNFPDRIRLIKNGCNLGADRSRNKGIAAARGSLVAFLDSDDMWMPNKLKEQVAFMQKKCYSFTYTGFIVKHGHMLSKQEVPSSLTRNQVLKNNRICTSTVIFDRDTLGNIMMPNIRKGQDLAFWLAIIKLTGVAQGLNKPFTIYRKLNGSLSSNKLDSAIWVWKLYRSIERLNWFQSLYFFTHYAFNGVIKHYKRGF